MPISYIKSNNTWQQLKNVFVKKDGSWKRIRYIYVKKNGVWNLVYIPTIELTISTSVYNYNILSNVIASLGYTPDYPLDVKLTVTSKGLVGSKFISNFGMTTGTFPTGSNLTIYNYGYIVGKGGNGGGNGTESNFGDGSPGGPALLVEFPTTIYNYGTIGGGGGGGGGGDGNGNNAPNGGGGAGFFPGVRGTGGWGGSGTADGTLTTGGQGSHGASGGNLGQPGVQYGSTGLPGQPGKAVIGYSKVTWGNLGTVLGPTSG